VRDLLAIFPSLATSLAGRHTACPLAPRRLMHTGGRRLLHTLRSAVALASAAWHA
jgi:hypothetical protein